MGCGSSSDAVKDTNKVKPCGPNDSKSKTKAESKPCNVNKSPERSRTESVQPPCCSTKNETTKVVLSKEDDIEAVNPSSLHGGKETPLHNEKQAGLLENPFKDVPKAFSFTFRPNDANKQQQGDVKRRGSESLHSHQTRIMRQPSPDTSKNKDRSSSTSKRSSFVSRLSNTIVKDEATAEIDSLLVPSSLLGNHIAESLTQLPGFSGSLSHQHHTSRKASKDLNPIIHPKRSSMDGGRRVSHVLPDGAACRSNDEVNIISHPDVSEEELERHSMTMLPSSGFSTTVITTAHKQHLWSSESFQSADVYDKALPAMLRVACIGTDNSILSSMCSNTSMLCLQRTTCLSPVFQKTLLKIASTMKQFGVLNVSKNNAGPVAFRALLTALVKHNCVEELDVSDNMANPDCAEVIRDLLIHCEKLLKLDVSGNQLGKESLSRSLSGCLHTNSNLVHLNISGCGASNLHGLFEALRSACLQEDSNLKHLNISNNYINDGLQLGIDISLILEAIKCQLKYLNVENTGLTASGWDAVVTSLRCNHSLRELIAGGNSNQVKDLNKIAEVIFANKNLTKLSLKGIRTEEQLNPGEVLIAAASSTAEMKISELDLSDCNLQDEFLERLADTYAGKLFQVDFLDVSYNSAITAIGMKGLKQLLSVGGQSKLSCLQLSGLKLDYLPNFLGDAVQKLTCLTLSKSRISFSALAKVFNAPQIYQEVNLSSIKMSGSETLQSVLTTTIHHRFTKLNLHGCALTDMDLDPLVMAISRPGPPLNTLTDLDISANRIETGLKELSNALLTTSNHPLNVLDASNNNVSDAGACGIADFIMSPTCDAKLTNLNLSHNCLKKDGINALVSTLASRPDGKGLVSLDVSNQQDGLIEEELEIIIETLATAIGLDVDMMFLENPSQAIPLLSPKFSVNLTNLGGSAGPRTRLLDSIAVKTDFTKVCNTSANLTDYLLIAAGLDKICEDATCITENGETAAFTTDQWSYIVGSDAPAWLKVEEDRKKSIYISRLPGQFTVQKLEGMLEMEADCEVSDVFVVKDPLFRKPTGAAWILFANEQSVQFAMQWYARGEAQMFGTPLCISSIPVSVLDAEDRVKAMAKRERAARDLARKQKEESDRALMESSQLVAEERAAYREAHPAYQDGRIW